MEPKIIVYTGLGVLKSYPYEFSKEHRVETIDPEYIERFNRLRADGYPLKWAEEMHPNDLVLITESDQQKLWEKHHPNQEEEEPENQDPEELQEPENKLTEGQPLGRRKKAKPEEKPGEEGTDADGEGTPGEEGKEGADADGEGTEGETPDAE